MESKDTNELPEDDILPRNFDEMVDKLLSDVPVFTEFRDVFVRCLQNVFIEYLKEVYLKSQELCNGEGRIAVLPGDIFKAVKVLKLDNFSQEIKVFYEHYVKPKDASKSRCGPEMTEEVAPAEQQRLEEVKALYEHYVKYKEASEYRHEAEMTEVAIAEQQRSAAEARANWKEELKDIFAKFWLCSVSTDLKEAGMTEIVAAAELQRLFDEACAKINEQMNTPQAEQPISNQSLEKPPLTEEMITPQAEQPTLDVDFNVTPQAEQPTLDVDFNVTPEAEQPDADQSLKQPTVDVDFNVTPEVEQPDI